MALMFSGNLTWTSLTSLGLAARLPCKCFFVGEAYGSVPRDFNSDFLKKLVRLHDTEL